MNKECVITCIITVHCYSLCKNLNVTDCFVQRVFKIRFPDIPDRTCGTFWLRATETIDAFEYRGRSCQALYAEVKSVMCCCATSRLCWFSSATEWSPGIAAISNSPLEKTNRTSSEHLNKNCYGCDVQPFNMGIHSVWRHAADRQYWHVLAYVAPV